MHYHYADLDTLLFTLYPCTGRGIESRAALGYSYRPLDMHSVRVAAVGVCVFSAGNVFGDALALVVALVAVGEGGVAC